MAEATILLVALLGLILKVCLDDLGFVWKISDTASAIRQN